MRHIALAPAALAALWACAFALPVHHVHREALNEVIVTVERTQFVTIDAPAALPTEDPALAAFGGDDSAPAAVPTASTELPPPIAPPVATPPATPLAPAPDASSSPAPAPDAGVGSSGVLGITYSPYKPGGCKDAGEVARDIAKLAGYSIIRLYGTDCDQVANVKNALQPGQKLFLGIFDVGDIQGGVDAMKAGLNGDWNLVDTVSVGNELVNNGQASPAQVAQYVGQARAALSAAGYGGPVVAVDTFIATINNPQLCDISDYVAVNAHAFFDGNILPQDAGSWAVQQIQRVWTACGGKKNVRIVETGWPSAGQALGKAVPSPENQKLAVDSIKSAVGNDCFLFTAFNDLWKAPGYLSTEQSWGIFGNS